MAIVLSGSTGIDAGSLPVANTGKISAGSGLPAILNTAGVDRVTVDTAGNVGIGTSSPTLSLDIVNTSTTGTSTDNAIIRLKSNNRNSALQLDTIGGSYAGVISNYANGTNVSQLKFDASGNILSILPNGGLGYGTGAGGTVTQLTSKATTVTLNKPTGFITMNNAALAAGASVEFNVNNTLVTGLDVISISAHWNTVNPSNYRIETVMTDSAGLFRIRVTNTSTGSLSEAVQFKYVVIKGANS